MQIESLYRKAGYAPKEMKSEPRPKEMKSEPRFFTFIARPRPSEALSDRQRPSCNPEETEIKVVTTSKELVLSLLRLPLPMQYDLLYALAEASLDAVERFVTVEYGNRTFIASMTRMDASHLMILHIS